MCSTATSSPVHSCQARVQGHILLLWLLLPLTGVSGKPAPCPESPSALSMLKSLSWPFPCLQMQASNVYDDVLCLPGGCKNAHSCAGCASHPLFLLWLQLQELDVYADLLPFLAVRGFAFMRSMQLLEVYYSMPEEEREKGPKASELVSEYHAWQLVQCETPSKKRQASSGDYSVV